MEDRLLKNVEQDVLQKVCLLLENSNWPYLFIVSNDKDVRNFFENNLKNKSELINSLSDYKLYNNGNTIINKLYEKNLLLLNIEEKEKELEEYSKEVKSPFVGNALYYALAFARESIEKTKHFLVVVCSEDLAQKILSANPTVSSCSNFFFIDDILEVERKKIEATTRNFESGILDVDSNPEKLEEITCKNLVMRRKLIENRANIPNNNYY